MSIRSLFLATTLLAMSSANASELYPLTNTPLQINHCNLEVTDNALDLALRNDGYFVLSNGKKNNELLFSRYGRFMLNADGYVINDQGFYLHGINKNSDPNKLGKFKISSNDLPPKATSKINVIVNLPSQAPQGTLYLTQGSMYDALAGLHQFVVEYTKMKDNIWEAQVIVDDIKLNNGQLAFDSMGKLDKQEGLSHIKWPANHGLNNLKIDYTGSTGYAAPFYMHSITHNGYSLGSIIGITIDHDGDIFLSYNNGQYKKLKNSIAVAKFTNPSYLQLVLEHMYRPAEKSGSPMLHRLNSQYAILSGAFENESCLR